MKWLLLLLAFSLSADSLANLEEKGQDFVLEIKQLQLPQYPTAFNPSIIRWRDSLLLSFRIIPNRATAFTSFLGLIWLDEDFTPIGEPQLLNTREPTDLIPSRAEDGRLILIGERLYFVYSDNSEPAISKGGFRVYLSEVDYDGSRFFLVKPECLSQFEGETRQRREKNWAPFDHYGELMLSYSLSPHRIFHPLLGTGSCETIASTFAPLNWDWGDLRGGTAGLIVAGEYLAFFHSCKRLTTAHSDGKEILHYFIGAYTYNLYHPFGLTHISPEPIIAKGFYSGGPAYKPYWHAVRAVFPCGYVFDDHFIWLAYGRQDHELWIAKLDKAKLLQSLVPISSVTAFDTIDSVSCRD